MAWSATFAPDAGSVRRARAWLDDALVDSGVAAAIRDDALLVAGELAGNAVRHARTEFTVSACVERETLRIEVFDRDTRPPALLGLDDDSTSGRGLHLVAAVADDWGWHTADDDAGVSGKVVWAALRTDQPTPTA
jgi:anti-sigma regulatory factor (Ser/Thr protein kinase)